MIQNYVKMFGKEEAEDLGKRIAKYYYAVWALKQVTDDKSVVCMMNEKANVSPQNTVYYYEPNWKLSLIHIQMCIRDSYIGI